MPDRLFVSAELRTELEPEEKSKLKQTIAEDLKQREEIGSPRVMVKEESDTTTFGFSVKTNLEELATNPGNGRYLGLFIIDDEAEVVSEKFILNPAIKQQRGRFPLVLDILAQNDVDEILLSTEPDEDQLELIEGKNYGHRVLSSSKLEQLRENSGDLI